ncbi:MAG: pyridoxal-phosphate dependent enzyme, partial [Myxococcales bacterium]|nr:pyridoxal-phosphate dependent enzyme [Myxococcales bacterium]
MVTVGDIRSAQVRIGNAVYKSPCAQSKTFSDWCGNDIYFKLENLQMSGSFKERGALNRLLLLPEEERRHGVIAASAGNHAQGLSYHATRLGIQATIVMPEYTPLIKVRNTKRYGAKVVLAGADYDAATAIAAEMAEASGATMVHAFNHPDIIAGQGTVGLELLEQAPDLDCVLVPTGGGGLLAGIAVAMKDARP